MLVLVPRDPSQQAPAHSWYCELLLLLRACQSQCSERLRCYSVRCKEPKSGRENLIKWHFAAQVLWVENFSEHGSMIFQVLSYFRKFDFCSFSIVADFFSSSLKLPDGCELVDAKQEQMKSFTFVKLFSIKWKLIKIKTSIWNRLLERRVFVWRMLSFN